MAELTRVDSAIGGLSMDDHSPSKGEDVKEEKKHHKRLRPKAEGIWNIRDIEKQEIELSLPIETQSLGWKLNTPSSTVANKDWLKLYLVTPPVKKIDLHFPLGSEVTARNLKGVTIKDALDVMFKHNKKKTDEELENPYLAGFEWDKKECWTRLIVHQRKEAQSQPTGQKSKITHKDII